MKKGVWKFDFLEQMDEQYNLMKKYALLVEKDTEGLFKGEIRCNLDTISLWICNIKKPDYFIKFLELVKNQSGDTYPAKLLLSIKGRGEEGEYFNNAKELEKLIIKHIKSDIISKSLGKFLNIF